MKLKLCVVLAAMFLFASCQFTETMVLHPDGSGSMSMELNLDQMIEITQGMSDKDETFSVDTLVWVKDLMEEHKDSIAQLPKEEQKRLKALNLEKYNIRINANSETSTMRYNLSADFKTVDEMNGIMEAFESVAAMTPRSEAGTLNSENGSASEDFIGVRYSFKNNKFVRDAYIKDKEVHKRQIDSMQSVEAFLGASVFSLNYTFPKRVKSISNEKATLMNNGKTVKLQVPFVAYFKNPDILDLEVELEN